MHSLPGVKSKGTIAATICFTGTSVDNVLLGYNRKFEDLASTRVNVTLTMIEQNKYDTFITELILSDSVLAIKKVIELTPIKSVLFVEEQYPEIKRLIQKQEWKQIKEREEKPDKEFKEYLDIMRFKDQHHNEYVVTIYDNDELFQDPQIIDIFPLK